MTTKIGTALQTGLTCMQRLVRPVKVTVDGYKVPNLGHQLLHKYTKCEHQPSGRGLLLTISTSVGKYLYAGELIEKTHFMSRESHSTDQGKMRNYVQGSNGPLDSLI